MQPGSKMLNFPHFPPLPIVVEEFVFVVIMFVHCFVNSWPRAMHEVAVVFGLVDDWISP